MSWAVETLAVDPAERLLEVGCGGGVAAAAVCERLVSGRLLAIDRSPGQIERARKRNERHVAVGRLELVAAELADLTLDEAAFDKIFAINVNVFWTSSAEPELAQIRNALGENGTLYLFYELPSASRRREIAERVGRNLEAAGLTSSEARSRSSHLLGCVARAALPGAARRRA